jgi:threonine synthase
LTDIEAVVARETVAESIQVGNPVSLGWRALAALRESGGTAAAVSDREILEAQVLIGRLAGIFAEPAAAVSVAVAKKLRGAGIIRPGDSVVCNVTGHGRKQPEAIPLAEDELAPIAPTLGALRERISRASERRR